MTEVYLFTKRPLQLYTVLFPQVLFVQIPQHFLFTERSLQLNTVLFPRIFL